MRELFEFNKRSNEYVIHTMIEAGFAHKRVIEEISHILNTHYMWIAKMAGERYNKNLWQPISMDDLFKANNLVHSKTEEFLKKNLSEKISIELEGEIVDKKIETVLYEVILFSNQHRAKVDMLFKKFNIQPPNYNYINFKKLELAEDF